MADNDIRWKQRLDNYTNALSQLADAVETRATRELSRLEAMGLVQAFEFTYELGWNLLKDYLTHQGITDLVGSRDTIRAAVSQSILSEQDGTVWMAMLADRNRTSHLYDEESVRAIEATITAVYYPVLRVLRERMAARAVLFGSRAEGTARDGSDIDLALEGVDLDDEAVAQIRNALDDLLLPVSVDIVRITSNTKPALKEHIQRVGIQVYPVPDDTYSA